MKDDGYPLKTLSPDSRSSTATCQVLHGAFEELFAKFGPFSVAHRQHVLEHCAGNSICNTYCRRRIVCLLSESLKLSWSKKNRTS